MNSKCYDQAKQKYKKFSVEPDKAVEILKSIPISIHAWQLDDVLGFETKDSKLVGGGGILSTGNYPGKAENIEQFRADLEMVLSLVPGTKKLSGLE